jgi:hypothetical protein
LKPGYRHGRRACVASCVCASSWRVSTSVLLVSGPGEPGGLKRPPGSAFGCNGPGQKRTPPQGTGPQEGWTDVFTEQRRRRPDAKIRRFRLAMPCQSLAHLRHFAQRTRHLAPGYLAVVITVQSRFRSAAVSNQRSRTAYLPQAAEVMGQGASAVVSATPGPDLALGSGHRLPLAGGTDAAICEGVKREIWRPRMYRRIEAGRLYRAARLAQTAAGSRNKPLKAAQGLGVRQ